MATGIVASTARQSAEQQVHYLRFTVNFNDAGIATGNGKQWLPKGAVLIGTDVNIVTAFNAATTNVLSVGIEASTYANIVTSAQTVSGTTGLKQNLAPTGTALVPLAADSQVFALYTQTGTAASAGQAVIIVKYIPNNDIS
ncbi:hypothetical protein IVB46_20930 [Bradyrhizobium sp. 61]|uniref:hypothetical protein n=1 Tax=Bradyrhizobium sp. 61 TaxID=2782679 RepID=UPI001FF8E449|nr:hypothetical protein [Bradyrhizobium sp. 61]MCK1277679.1 hypothetical protein [Bradyrhizobium sp. 61]